ncbi:hypothetical protein GQ55_5G389900 [Panicum hallii var. hallii]|uniref:Uncharacterized protein n=1 Tax=Panicum hallii var. hallii TaxID=1504633 RepID=A0A2T7DMZ7_9POAL|nr:hypothetical protein GQ55_5G389900 [Panicum hallii var. hallii]
MVTSGSKVEPTGVAAVSLHDHDDRKVVDVHCQKLAQPPATGGLHGHDNHKSIGIHGQKLARPRPPACRDTRGHRRPHP